MTLRYSVVRVVEPNPHVIDQPVGRWRVETKDSAAEALQLAAQLNESRFVPQWVRYVVEPRELNFVLTEEW